MYIVEKESIFIFIVDEIITRYFTVHSYTKTLYRILLSCTAVSVCRVPQVGVNLGCVITGCLIWPRSPDTQFSTYQLVYRWKHCFQRFRSQLRV